MAQSRQKLNSMLGLAAAAMLVAGCGHVATHVTRAAAPGLDSTAPVSADVRACAGVQAVIGHLTAGTVRWSPTLDPFDKAISAQIRLLSKELDKQAPQAQTPRVQEVVHSNARAFTAVAAAMTSKNAQTVSRAIDASRLSYRDLKKVCALK
jgi:hypothetical protein